MRLISDKYVLRLFSRVLHPTNKNINPEASLDRSKLSMKKKQKTKENMQLRIYILFKYNCVDRRFSLHIFVLLLFFYDFETKISLVQFYENHHLGSNVIIIRVVEDYHFSIVEALRDHPELTIVLQKRKDELEKRINEMEAEFIKLKKSNSSGKIIKNVV